jgi:hypothetical protein
VTFNKTCLVIATASVVTMFALALRSGPAEKPAAVVMEDDDVKIFVNSSKIPQGRWLILVPWEDIQDQEVFDDLVPFRSAQCVLAVKDGKCAVISRQTATDRINSSLQSLK